MAESIAKQKKRIYWKDYLYILPAVFIISVFFLSSIFYTVRLSFFEWDGFSEMTFKGFDNYRFLFQEQNFIISVMNTLIWVVSSMFTSVIAPLLLAILITRSSALTFFKNIFYFPTALSGTVGGLIMAILLSTYGLPRIFIRLGKPELARDWLAIPYVNTFIMILTGVWQGIGLNMLLFISGIRNMDASPVEAAKIEGAGTVKLYIKVILPLLKPTVIVVILMTLVNSFKVFDGIWVMTKGGPYRTSETLALTMYEESFIYNNFGVGAAVAVVLTIVILLVSYFNIRNSFKED